MASYPTQAGYAPMDNSVNHLPFQGQSVIGYAELHRKTFFGLALSQVILGVCCVGLGIPGIPICANDGCVYSSTAYIEYYAFWTRLSTGIWCGAMVITCGSFGLAQVYDPSPARVTINLILSILGSLISIVMLGLEVMAACNSYHKEVLVILHAIIASFSFTLFILFLTSASYAGTARGCCHSCCYDNNVQRIVSPETISQNVVSPSGQSNIIHAGAPQYGSQVTVPSAPDASPPQYSAVPQPLPHGFPVAPGSRYDVPDYGSNLPDAGLPTKNF